MKEVKVEEYLYDEYGDRCGEVEVSSYFVNDETTIKDVVDVFAPSEFVESVEYHHYSLATIVVDGTRYSIGIHEREFEPTKPQPYFTKEIIEDRLKEERGYEKRYVESIKRNENTLDELKRFDIEFGKVLTDFYGILINDDRNKLIEELQAKSIKAGLKMEFACDGFITMRLFTTATFDVWFDFSTSKHYKEHLNRYIKAAKRIIERDKKLLKPHTDKIAKYEAYLAKN